MFLILVAGCSRQNITGNTVNNVNNTNVNPCKDISVKANIVNINQEKKWVSVKLNNDGNNEINSILIKILGEKLIAKVKKPLSIGENRVETTNYGNLVNNSIGLEIVPLTKIGDIEITCSTKGIVLYKKATK